MVSRVSLRGLHDEPGAIRDLARGDFDASIIQGRDRKHSEEVPECRILCADIEVMNDLSACLPGVWRSEMRADGFGELKMSVSSEDVKDAILENFGIEVADLL